METPFWVFAECSLDLLIIKTKSLLKTVINASAAATLLEQRPEKIQALSWIRYQEVIYIEAITKKIRST